MLRVSAMKTLFQFAVLALLALTPLLASEHHGAVTFNGVPVPGATVTASP